MFKRILLFLFVPMLAWIPMVIWVTSGLWSPDFFGGAAPYPGDGRPISNVITYSLVGLIIAVQTLALVIAGLIALAEKREKQRIISEGRSAKATVISIGENNDGANIKINGRPYLGLVLEVDDGNRVPYIVSLDTLIPTEAIPRYQPGALVDVKIDKDNPKNIIIVP